MAITKITTPELFDFSATNTALQLPTGDTASRPSSPSAGEWRYNTTLKYVEFYDGANWFRIDTEAIPGPTPVGNENFNVNTYFGNAATQTLDAKFNEAANFNGSSSRIEIPAILSSGYTGSLSYSCWFKTSVTDSNLRTIIEPGEINSSGNFTIFIINGKLRLSYYNLDSGGSTDGSTTVSDGQWHNIVGVLNNSTGNLDYYLDGNTTAEISHTFTAGSTIDAFANQISHFGGSYYQPVGYFRFFSGKLDQVRIYNTALTAAQAEDLWTDETTITAATLDFPVGAGCIAAYQLDGNGNDISANYNSTSTTDIGYTGLKFSADLAWIKQRSLPARDHVLFDTVRGPATNLSILYPNLTNAEDAGGSTFLSSISSNALNLGSSIYVNESSLDYVAWCWKAPDAFSHSASGSGSGSTLASTGKSNQAAGFSIVKFAVPSVSNGESRKIKHNLGGIPELIIYKTLNSSQATSWFVNTPSIGNDHELFFNTNDAKSGTTTRWNNTTPDITTFDIGPAILDYTGGSNTDYYGGDTIAYCFKSIPGYSKVGTYLGDQQNPGPTINTGFKPGWLLVKCIDRSDNWVILDSKRGDGNALFPNLTSEQFPNYNTDFNATGFQIKNVDYSMNFSGDEYLYMAFAE